MKEKLPQHVAIVMDGNGRWALQQGLPRIEGHRAGVQAVKEIVRCCAEMGIQYLSLFAFSSENWARPADEVEFLMSLFLEALNQEIAELHQSGIRLCFTGDRRALSESLQEQMQQAERLTEQNKKLLLNVMVNYGGKWDILTATQKIIQAIEKGELAADELDEQHFDAYLDTYPMPDPDLFIRTSGELRISNFYLWQLAYTELYFTEVFWPDFRTEEFKKALKAFSQRKRRFGQVSE